jgi:hypothetical protein
MRFMTRPAPRVSAEPGGAERAQEWIVNPALRLAGVPICT